MELRIARNILVAAGAFYVCGWIAEPLTIGLGKLTEGTVYTGEFNGYVVMPLVDHLPQALMAGVAGAMVVWLVESNRRTPWALLPAALYVLFGFYGYHWSRPPLVLDRISETVGAIFPAAACFIGGLAVSQRLTHQHH